ncbi:unnamed protein product, partial [Mesorhabditis spiculigera]
MRNVECTVEHLQTSSVDPSTPACPPRPPMCDLDDRPARTWAIASQSAAAPAGAAFSTLTTDSTETVRPQGAPAWIMCCRSIVFRLIGRVEDCTDVTARVRPASSTASIAARPANSEAEVSACRP